MVRGLGQTSYGGNNLLASQFSRFWPTLPAHQHRESGSACHRRNASFGFKADFGNASVPHLDAEPEDVAADRIRNLRHRVWIIQFAGVSRMFEMIEQLRRIHLINCKGETADGYRFAVPSGK